MGNECIANGFRTYHALRFFIIESTKLTLKFITRLSMKMRGTGRKSSIFFTIKLQNVFPS